MATAVQGLQGAAVAPPEAWRTPEGVHLFGIRHLSAAGAWHLRRFLDDKKPRLVLIESPSDTTALIPDLVKAGVKPPVAVLCYTTGVPVHSIVYPLATYSPEYQGILWARENKRESRFIDLPSDVKAALYRAQDAARVAMRQQQQEVLGEDSELPEELQSRVDYYQWQNELYEELARLGGEGDYDAYWERCFEHNLETGSYLRGVALHSAEMRALTQGWEREADPLAASVNYLRESYMKRQIQDAIHGGISPEEIVVVCGAYHVQGLMECAPITDEELAELPRAETRMTLMPYSYYRLSSFSGYGAGNHAPYYYEMMYALMEEGRLEALPALYLSQLSREYREKHGYSSTASVIEAVRLAGSLQALHGGLMPTLADLHDSAVATVANGEYTAIAQAFAAVDVGTRIGALPEGVSQTPIQDDMNRQLKRLKLEKYKTVVAQDLALDLRENRRVQSEEAAFLDLDRSVFLNRLALLGIGFARPAQRRQDSATWAENWVLHWTPEVEIQVVESVLYGDTVEAAAAYVMKERLERSGDVLEVARLVRQTCDCRLTHSVVDAVARLQELASESESFSGVARAAREMSFLIQYGSVRRFETGPVIPILQQLFLKGALLLHSSASCNDDAAREMADDMTLLHQITQEQDELVADDLWLAQVRILAEADDRNPLLCGFAFSILLERGLVQEEELYTQVSLHLSPGNSPEGGAAWFEGLSRRNRYVLLSRIMLWQQLDGYLSGLDDEEFKRSLVCLRRAFSSFEPHEKSGICEILADLWGVDAVSAAQVLQEELSQAEEEALDSLSDFDFDFDPLEQHAQLSGHVRRFPQGDRTAFSIPAGGRFVPSPPQNGPWTRLQENTMSDTVQTPEQNPQLSRWRLILGKSSEEKLGGMGSGPLLDQRETAMDQALAAIYDQTGGEGGARSAGLGPSYPNLAKWLADVRSYFPSDVVSVIQADAIERKGLKQLLLEPETLATVKPDINMVSTLLSLQGQIPKKSKEQARQLVQALVDEIMEQMESDMRRAVTGALNRRAHSPIPSLPNTDWKRTINKNLKNYDRERKRIIPERFYFFENHRKSKDWTVILDMDQSGSMASSIIYASIMGSIFASLPALDTRIVAFDTQVVDLTESCGDDPVDILFGVQLGGGTDINKSVKYCTQFVENPKKTMFILISDLYEGGVEAGLLRQLGDLKESGVTVLVLLALSDDGVPSYDKRLAAKIAAMGIPSFGCTPARLPELIGGALRGDDLHVLADRVKIGGKEQGKTAL